MIPVRILKVTVAAAAVAAAICHFFKKVLRTLVTRHYQAMALSDAEI